MSYTYALLEVSKSTYEEIRKKFLDAGYGMQIRDTKWSDKAIIDMHGIALTLGEDDDKVKKG